MLVIIALLVYNHGHCFNSTAQEILINREDEIEKRNGPGTALRRWLDSDRILCNRVRRCERERCAALQRGHSSTYIPLVYYGLVRQSSSIYALSP